MSREKSGQSDVEAAVKNCYSTWSDSYYRDYYQSEAAYPPIHTKIVRECLQKAGVRTLLDAGCGPASMLRDLDGLGIERYGFDLTPEMVDEARRVMASQGVPETNIWQGSVLDEKAFSPPVGHAGYDAAICFGVFPHIPPSVDMRVLTNLTNSVRNDGLVMVEARNQLFALFTLNRYSRDFFLETLIKLPELRQQASAEESSRLDEAVGLLDQRFRLDLPPVRKGRADEPGYDEVLSRTHNPFELRAAAEKAGLRDVSVLFYHYHCLPPMVESLVPKLFRRASVALEDPTDWRGHFMASAFILVGYKAEL
jgi:2-polyprenyl-3-methyl-5-hydroxy-6-metoxy-1,4-benzoquinol methylase